MKKTISGFTVFAVLTLLVTPASADSGAPPTADHSNRITAGDETGDGTAIVHGAISGVIFPSSGTSAELPLGEEWFPSSRLDREFHDLLTTLHKGSRRGREERPLGAALWNFFTLRDPGSDSPIEETLLDPVLGEISLTLAARLHRMPRPTLQGGESTGLYTFAEMRRTLLAAMERSAADSAPSSGFDPMLAPISVNTASFDGSSGVGAGFSAGLGTSPGVTPPADATLSAPPPLSGGVLASALVNWSSTAWNEDAGGGTRISTPALNPPGPPAGSYFAPSPFPVSRSSAGFSSPLVSASPALAPPSAPTPRVLTGIAAPAVGGSNPPLLIITPSATGNGIGVADPSTGIVYERDTLTAGAPNRSFAYGAPGWTWFAGDWNGDGTKTIGAFDPSTATFYLRNSNSAGGPDIAPFAFGAPGWKPIIGDWNGDGTDTIGVFNPSTATFFLRNSNSAGPPDLASFVFGLGSWTPLAGDWNGDGTDTIGVFNPSTATFYLRNSNSAGAPDYTFQFGQPGWLPIVGDWNGDGIDTIGVFDPSTATFYLRNSNSAGGPDITPFTFGTGSMQPFSFLNVPEPATGSLLGIGCTLAILRRRRRF